MLVACKFGLSIRCVGDCELIQVCGLGRLAHDVCERDVGQMPFWDTIKFVLEELLIMLVIAVVVIFHDSELRSW